jgi:hypothetical protein
VGAIGELLGCGQVANIGGFLPLGIFDKWQNHFFSFWYLSSCFQGFYFYLFSFYYYSFFFFLFHKGRGG